ncbi:element excision factor XisI family protein [Dapis sp. BLCC M126]|uniref:element excision factor XisI family protein n=1 Tax=Dapis sp. BLCC M126 TaxID=3400189 RepID=UPI003CE7C77F
MNAIFDDEKMRYMAIWVGWYKYKCIHQCIIHINIVEGCILIQSNDMEESIVAKLAGMGIYEDKIRLGFIHPKHQEHIEKEANVVSMSII